MGESDLDLVRSIYGFDWAAVGGRRVGFVELEALVTEDFTSQLSPELGGRAVAGVGALQELTQALESDFSEFRYDGDEFILGEGGRVIVPARSMPAAAPAGCRSAAASDTCGRSATAGPLR